MSVAKNNNLNIHREKLRIKNEALVRRAIKHINKLGGDITFSSVSNVTFDIANIEDGEKGLTLPAISTSKVYRPIIEEAKIISLSSNQENNLLRSNQSIGDMKVLFHGLRIENAKLKIDNKILKESLIKINKPSQKIENIESTMLEQLEEMQSVTKSLIDRLLELELAYIDTSNFALNVFVYDELIMPHDALKLFYKKELDELQSKICG